MSPEYPKPSDKGVIGYGLTFKNSNLGTNSTWAVGPYDTDTERVGFCRDQCAENWTDKRDRKQDLMGVVQWPAGEESPDYDNFTCHCFGRTEKTKVGPAPEMYPDNSTIPPNTFLAFTYGEDVIKEIDPMTYVSKNAYWTHTSLDGKIAGIFVNEELKAVRDDNYVLSPTDMITECEYQGYKAYDRAQKHFDEMHCEVQLTDHATFWCKCQDGKKHTPQLIGPSKDDMAKKGVTAMWAFKGKQAQLNLSCEICATELAACGVSCGLGGPEDPACDFCLGKGKKATSHSCSECFN